MILARLQSAADVVRGYGRMLAHEWRTGLQPPGHDWDLPDYSYDGAEQLAEAEAGIETWEPCPDCAFIGDWHYFDCPRVLANTGESEVVWLGNADVFRSGGQTYETGPRLRLSTPPTSSTMPAAQSDAVEERPAPPVIRGAGHPTPLLIRCPHCGEPLVCNGGEQ